MIRTLYPFVLFLALNLLFMLGLNLTSCKNGSTKANSVPKQEKKSAGRISKIEINEFGKTSILNFSYDKQIVNIEMQPAKGNVDARLEFDDQNLLQEVISGRSRIQYLYDGTGRKIGMLSGNGSQQVMFEYDDGKISAQHNFVGRDTVASYYYEYLEDSPTKVRIEAGNQAAREYTLYYLNEQNSLSGFNEMILPSEIVNQLGFPAMYGEKYLRRAKRTDEQANKDQPLKESYTPPLNDIVFTVHRSGNQETLKLVSDGTREWNAKIHW